jgi:hypothetical protein
MLALQETKKSIKEPTMINNNNILKTVRKRFEMT